MVELSDPIVLKGIISTITPLIKNVVEQHVGPKINSLKQRFNLDHQKYHIPSEEHFSEYYHRIYKKLSILNTLVFNNSQRLLKDVYMPLTVVDSDSSAGIKIDSYPENVMNDYEKVLITDTAGMGKSTLMKRIFLDIIDNNKGIPIFIELRRLTDEKTIIQEIHEQINSIDKVFDEQLLLEFINEGGFVFILDGYDEISLKNREVVTKDIQDFISKAQLNKFILTSRPENALASFGDFRKFNIQPLRRKEAFELLRKYDKQGAISSLLIKKLGESHMSNIDEFLTNPLLVSLLFLAFQYKQAIPFKKYLFYRQVYDANFESHDLTKGESYIHDKYSNLEVDDFHRVMRHIGFQCLKEQKIEFTKDEILKVIARSRKFCVGLTFKESDFLNDLIVTVPLFVQDGIYYKWAHKSLQEYFAAQFIYLDTSDKKTNYLEKIYDKKEFDKYINIVDLYYDMDIKSFRNVILYKYLKEYREYYNQVNKRINLEVTKELREFRTEACFNNKLLIVKMDGKNTILDEDFDKMAKRYTSSNKNKFEQRFYSITLGTIVPGIAFVRLSTPHDLIRTILAKKAHPVIRDMQPIPKIKYDFTEKINNIIKDFELKDEFEICACENNPFNSKELFEFGNCIIRKSSRGMKLINTEVAISLIDEIEDDIKEEKNDDLFDI